MALGILIVLLMHADSEFYEQYQLIRQVGKSVFRWYKFVLKGGIGLLIMQNSAANFVMK